MNYIILHHTTITYITIHNIGLHYSILTYITYTYGNKLNMHYSISTRMCRMEGGPCESMGSIGSCLVKQTKDWLPKDSLLTTL